MRAVDAWATWLGALLASAGVPVPSSRRARQVARAMAWQQLLVLLAAWVVAMLALGTGLLVLVLLGRPDLRVGCLGVALGLFALGAVVAMVPLLRPRRLARRLGLGRRDRAPPGPPR